MASATIELVRSVASNWLPSSITGLLVTGVIVVVVLALINALILQPVMYLRHYKQQGVPALPYKPVVGNIAELREFTQAPFGALNQLMFDKHGKDVKHVLFFFGFKPRLMVFAADTAQDILVRNNRCFQKPGIMKSLLSPVLGNGLLLSEGATHAHNRKMLSPAFHFGNLRLMQEDMVQCSIAATQKWLATAAAPAPSAATPSVEMSHAMSNLTLRIVCRAVFGVDVRDPGFSDSIYENLNTVLEQIFASIRTGLPLIPGFSYLPTPGNRRVKAAISKMNTRLQRLIQQRRVQLKNNPEARDLLALLIRATQGSSVKPATTAAAGAGAGAGAGSSGAATGTPRMSDEQLRDEAMTFILAGHETTSQLMCWVMYLLSKHPAWQEKARAEVDAVVGDRPVTYADLANLPIMNSILLETLRLYPPAPNVPRLCVQDHALSTGVKVAKGTVVIVSTWSIHRSELNWERPHEFDPSRFAKGQRAAMAGKHPMAFLPFSAGARDCIGKNFALLEARTILATMLQRVHFALHADYVHHPSFAVTLRPKFGMPVVLTPRLRGGNTSAANDSVGADAESDS